MEGQLNVKPTNVTDKYLDHILKILREALSDVECTALLFGSRADGAAVPGSDYDIGVAADRNVERELARARFSLEESNIPVNVDLVDLSLADPDFRQEVLRSGIVLWKNSKNVSIPAAGL